MKMMRNLCLILALGAGVGLGVPTAAWTYISSINAGIGNAQALESTSIVALIAIGVVGLFVIGFLMKRIVLVALMIGIGLAAGAAGGFQVVENLLPR